MMVVTVYCNGEIMPAEKLNPQLHDRFLEGYLLCNDSQLGEQGDRGSHRTGPAHMGKERGVKKEVLEKQKPRIGEQPLTPRRNTW